MNLLRKFNTDLALRLILIWCVFSVKIALGGDVRIDDLLIAVAFVILFFRGDLFSVPRSRPVNWYVVYVAASLLSALVNSYLGRVSLVFSLVFVARLVEYLLFYYIGYAIAMRGHTIRKLMTFYVYALAVLVPLQMIGIAPVFNQFGNVRASGNTNGPYELAAVAGFLLCYLGYEKRSFIKGSGSFILVVLSASRITFIGVIISLISSTLRLARRSLAYAVFASGSVIVVLLLSVSSSVETGLLADADIHLFDRFRTVEGSGATTTFFESYPTAPTYSNADDYFQGTFSLACLGNRCGEDVGDTSALVRTYKWAALIKSTLASGESIVIGLGPSFASTAVDGYYVRNFAETGLVGLTLFLVSIASFWNRRAKSQWAFREYVIILLVTACFIDIFTSYKPMMLLWLWHGINEAKLRLEERELVAVKT